MRSSRVVVLVSLLSVPWLATCRDLPTDPEPADLMEAAESELSAKAEASQQAREDQPIPNRYLVIFEDNVSNPGALARNLAGAKGLGIRHTYSHAIKGFAAEFPEAGRDAVIEALQRNPNVRYVEQDKLWYIDTHEALTGIVEVAAPPTDPSNLAATAQGANAVGLTWSDNSSDETGFQILRCEGAGCVEFTAVASTGKNKTSYTDTELTAATEYCYEIRAQGGRGKNKTYSGPAGPACATTDSGGGDPPPTDERPTDLSATPSSSIAMDLSWTDNWDNESGFEIERCEGNECSGFTLVGEVGTNVTSYTDIGLTSDTEYCYRVRGVRRRGKKSTQTEYSNVDCGTTSVSPPDPSMDPPTGLSATSSTSTSADLSWTDNSDEEEFEIERCEDTGCENFVKITTVAADATSYTDNSLTAGTLYCYRVRGIVGGSPTGYSNTDCVTPTPDPSMDPPTGLNATSSTSTSADLSWTDNSDEEEFEIERCEGNGCSDFVKITAVAADATSHTDNGLTAGTPYCYRVRGIVGGSPTGYSNTDCVTPTSPPPGRFVEDSYEDSPGTLLQSHTGATGATWTPHFASGGNAQFSSTGSEVESGTQAVYMASGLPPGADYRVAAHMYFHTTSSGGVTYSFVTGRMDETSLTMYMFGFVYSGVNRWELKKFVNGTETLLASSTEGLPSPGDSPLVDLQMEGSTIKGVVDGIDIVSATDTDITATGRAGLRMLTGSSQSASPADFEATTLDLAPPPPPPSTDPPTDLTTTVLSGTSAFLSWTDNSGEDLFEIERCQGTGCTSFAYLGQVGADVTDYLDSGLTAGTEYCYQVRGIVGGAPTVYSNVICVTPDELPPGECPDTGNHDDLGQLWGITRTQANLNPTWLGTQTGGGCAIQAWLFGIDSGVDSDHPDLNVIEAVDFLQDGSGAEDGHGHGTHTAGTAAAVDGNGGVVGMAPGAPVFGFKVCGNDGSCSLSAIIAAIDEVSARKTANPNQPMVANMSLGGDPSPAMEEAVRKSINDGV
ncbi:fibronectin type III domain-containing protein, partial [Gemmatimonadota bacterium]